MTKERVARLTQLAIEAIELHLQEVDIDTSIASISEAQILRFRENLRQMIDQLEKGDDRAWNPGMGRAIVDGWPFESKVGNAILEAEGAFLDLQGIR